MADKEELFLKAQLPRGQRGRAVTTAAARAGGTDFLGPIEGPEQFATPTPTPSGRGGGFLRAAGFGLLGGLSGIQRGAQAGQAGQGDLLSFLGGVGGGAQSGLQFARLAQQQRARALANRPLAEVAPNLQRQLERRGLGDLGRILPASKATSLIGIFSQIGRGGKFNPNAQPVPEELRALIDQRARELFPNTKFKLKKGVTLGELNKQISALKFASGTADPFAELIKALAGVDSNGGSSGTGADNPFE